MAASLYITWNASTSALSSPMTGTTVTNTTKTVLQVKPGNKIQVIEAGYTFSSVPTAAVQMELIDTGSVFATVTSGSVSNYNTPTLTTSAATLSTTGTGFNASAEGSITATRLLSQNFDQGAYFHQQFPLDREPEVLSGNSLRIRATTTGTAVIAAYIIWAE